jgi:hypothetical protein
MVEAGVSFILKGIHEWGLGGLCGWAIFRVIQILLQTQGGLRGFPSEKVNERVHRLT